MKLINVVNTQKCLVEHNIDDTNLKIVLTENLKKDDEYKIEVICEGKQNFADLIAKHPILTGMLAGMGAAAIKKYYQNKRRHTTMFFGKTAEDKKMYKKIIKDLMKTGNYKLKKTEFVDGGQLWVLQQEQR